MTGNGGSHPRQHVMNAQIRAVERVYRFKCKIRACLRIALVLLVVCFAAWIWDKYVQDAFANRIDVYVNDVWYTCIEHAVPAWWTRKSWGLIKAPQHVCEDYTRYMHVDVHKQWEMTR